MAVYRIIAAVLVAAPAQAQSPLAPATQPPVPAVADIDDIIVTAQRRAERLQDVPIAVSAVGSEGLVRAGVSNLTDISAVVPALRITNNNGQVSPRMRGLGSTATGPGVENSIAIYIDGVYLGATVASLLSLNNVERVEVLKGPQGTLFGRNATGGLIQIITRTPEQTPTAEFRLSYGNYDAIDANAYIAGGLTKTLAMDVAVQYSRQGKGWGRNLGTGTATNTIDHDVVVRSKLVFDPDTGTVVTLTGDYADTDNRLNAGTLLRGTRAFVGGPVASYPRNKWDTNTNRDAFTRGWQAGTALTVKQPIGGVDLTSITAYRESRYRRAFDFDLTTNPQPNPVPALPYRYFDVPQADDQFSQELQFAGRGDGFNWIVGAFYYKAHGAFDPAMLTFEAPFGPVAPQGQVVEINGTVGTESIAGFAQGTLALGEATNLTLGLRYTDESKSITGTQRRFLIPSRTPVPIGPVTPQPDVDASKMSYRAAIDHHFTPDIMAYGSFNRSFKSGGFAAAAPSDPGYLPEELDAYEIGLKTQLFDRLLTFNVAAFHYDYRNIQIQIVTAAGTVTTNGPSAKIDGIDADFALRIGDGFRLTGGLQLVYDKFGSYPNALIGTALGGAGQTVGSASGNRLPLATRTTFTLAPSYAIDLAGRGTIDLSGSWNYNSGWYPEADNIIRQKPFSLVNATVRWTSTRGFNLGVWGKNLTNEQTFASKATLPGGRHFVIWTAPRTYGASVGYKF